MDTTDVMNNRFQFYEVVVVIDTETDCPDSVMGREGTVLGMAQDEKAARWTYAVSIESTGKVWNFNERQLMSTGKQRNRSDLYSGDSIQVKGETSKE